MFFRFAFSPEEMQASLLLEILCLQASGCWMPLFVSWEMFVDVDAVRMTMTALKERTTLTVQSALPCVQQQQQPVTRNILVVSQTSAREERRCTNGHAREKN
jgi:hypothetical protein